MRREMEMRLGAKRKQWLGSITKCTCESDSQELEKTCAMMEE